MHWIPWNDILATGHAELDSDHRTLVAMFNELADAVRTKKAKRACLDILDSLIEFTISHFKHEAQLMAEHNYPAAEEHNVEHVQLVKRARAFRAKFDVGVQGTYVDLAHFPEDWLTRHILTADRALCEFLANSDGERQVP